MNIIKTGLIAAVFCLAGCNASMPDIMQTSADVASAAGYNNQSKMVGGIKDLLELSSTRASTSLSQTGGYSSNPLYRINLPQSVQPIAKQLRQFGLGGQVDKVEALMNQGAERAAAEAKDVFVGAVRKMSVTDALGIIRGADTAATDYFRQQTESTLRQRYQPIIESNLQQIGFYTQYQQLLKTYNQLPIANKPSLDLEEHVLNQSLKVLFTEVAQQEKLIRKDPVGRGSVIIGAIFGQK